MTQLLASVRNVDEARIALSMPIGILDLKEPNKGALGALMPETLRSIVKLAQGKHKVSATIGDLPADADLAATAIEQWMHCGVDYIKLGFFSPEHLEVYPAVLKHYVGKTNLIAVLFADRTAHLEGPCHLLAATGCAGIMLDTADKNTGSIRNILNDRALNNFINTVHELSLICGIAGSLNKADIPPLVKLQPDYLGFRTALCEQNQRTAGLSRSALAELLEIFSSSVNPATLAKEAQGLTNRQSI